VNDAEPLARSSQLDLSLHQVVPNMMQETPDLMKTARTEKKLFRGFVWF